jgi:hypothetical protein
MKPHLVKKMLEAQPWEKTSLLTFHGTYPKSEGYIPRPWHYTDHKTLPVTKNSYSTHHALRYSQVAKIMKAIFYFTNHEDGVRLCCEM